MFRLGQIISATELIRNFKDISKYLYTSPQALLITQKSKEHLVLVNAEVFQDLLHFKLKAQGVNPDSSGIREHLEIKKRI